ncbi:MAG: FHA domain-containing protein [Chloroflexi bacterium]|nr:FHA domain-containing protein [Chloroflexota bacterium]
MAMEPRASLIMNGGPEDGTITSLGPGVFSIGRSLISNIVIDKPGISRHHASIRSDAEGFWIADAGSRNGTYLNGTKLGAEPVMLREGDKIELGGMAEFWVFAATTQTQDVPPSA